MLIIESGKREIAEVIEHRNQESLRTLGQKKNRVYFEILKADTNNKTVIKKKKKKSATEQQEKTLEPISTAETSSKGWTPWLTPC